MNGNPPPIRRTLGLIVNPIAGIGGRVGFKGSDGVDTVRKALEMGAMPRAGERAQETLERLAPLRDEIEIATYPGEMGESIVKGCGFSPEVLGSISSGATSAADTQRASRQLADWGVELILFAGGDGTARDIYEAVGSRVPVLGIPAGVKIHSSVYAVNPRSAAQLVIAFFKGQAPPREMEVLDIDEDLFRTGRVSAQLYGYMQVPFERALVQSTKAANSSSTSSLLAIAEDVVDNMSTDFLYILGPGTTVKAIGDELGIDKTLLGVDLVHRKVLIGKDLNETQLLQATEGQKTKIVVTVIGGQGYIFGRGNQQISPRVLRQVGSENVIVVATREKLQSLEGPLQVDTGDDICDRELSGYRRVIVGYREETVAKVMA